MAGIRSDVAELLVSHQLFFERVTAFEARADAAYTDSPGARDRKSCLEILVVGIVVSSIFN